MKNTNTPEKQCKYCYGKGYATQLRQYCIVGDFPGDITYTSEPEIIKIPCKCQQKQKPEITEEQETIDMYLQLLGAWGDSPLDEEGVKEILQAAVQKAREEVLQEVENILPYGANFTDRFYALKAKYLPSGKAGEENCHCLEALRGGKHHEHCMEKDTK